MIAPATRYLFLVLLLLLVSVSSTLTPAAAQETATPAAPPTAAQQALPGAIPITGGGRLFALPAGGGFPEGIAYDAATGDF